MEISRVVPSEKLTARKDLTFDLGRREQSLGSRSDAKEKIERKGGNPRVLLPGTLPIVAQSGTHALFISITGNAPIPKVSREKTFDYCNSHLRKQGVQFST